ncbi:MAG TPA: hypothetical protein DCS67_04405 [Clostridiales bacterium UBA8960]|jgi:DNA helicase-2/ATP-dependent DNA helicase PcrA|nr:hypothetical protein [Clostridiales bacterium UBA8960]
MTSNALTPSQLEASKHHIGPALTLAIPGSGKTTLLLHRLIELVETHGVSPDEILTLTFSKASAVDMAMRYEGKFAHLKYRFEFMTIHKFAYGLYKRYLNSVGKNMTLLEDGTQKFQVLNEIFKRHHKANLTEDEYESLNNHIGLIYNLRLTRDDLDAHEFQWKNIFDMAEDYHRFKNTHHFFDFDDMLLSAIKILKKSPALLSQIRNRYRFIQVDEAQDTSKLQFELIEMLLGADENLFLVADDDQSIYGFRGAYPSYLLNFPEKFARAKLFYLSDNFRSDANIVAAANAVIVKNKLRFAKEMRPYKDAIEKPAVRLFDDLNARNQYMIDTIKQTPGTKAILYRNKVSSLSVIDALERNALSFQIKDTPMREFNHWLLEDLIAFFTLAMVPQDLYSFQKIAFKMNGFISREMLNYVKLNHRGRNIFSVLVEIPFLMDYQTRTQEKIMAQFETLKMLRPYDGIHYIETELGYLDYVKSNAQRLGLSMNFARTRIDAFKAIAKPLKTGFDFITRINDLKTYLQENFNNSSEALTLSTIHGSKGLEFDEVYMIDVNPQIFPNFSATEGDALEEERRLFYVGLTRAKQKLELLHVEFINGSFNPNSLFIEEMLSKSFTNHCFNNATGKPATR